MNDVHSLSHTKWNCKYHIVFAPKYRRKVFYESRRLEVGAILRELCKWKDVEIIQAEVCPDHVHMLVSIPHGRAIGIHRQDRPVYGWQGLRRICRDRTNVLGTWLVD